jgi:1-acyl-sn-glycerol-3-phosphate acyltransferase
MSAKQSGVQTWRNSMSGYFALQRKPAEPSPPIPAQQPFEPCATTSSGMVTDVALPLTTPHHYSSTGEFWDQLQLFKKKRRFVDLDSVPTEVDGGEGQGS